MSTKEQTIREEYEKTVSPDMNINRSIKIFLNAFSLAYSIRGGISFLLNTFKYLRKSKYGEIFAINNINPEDSLRWGMFIGVFCGGFEAFKSLFNWLRGKKDHINTIIAGGLCGLSILFLGNHKGNMIRPIALYLMARAAQCVYNSVKLRGLWNFPGSKWTHFDSLFFVLATTQCFYAYYMRPNTLAPSYLKFLEKLSPVSPVAMKTVLESTRGLPIENWKEVNEWAKKTALPNILKQAPLSSPFPTIIPCSLVHPQSESCTIQQLYTIKKAVKMMFPIYLTINFVPMVVTRFWSLLKNPTSMIYKIIKSSARSTLVLTLISMITMGLSCLVRKVFERDSKFKFYLISFLAPWPMMLEHKTKRAEFALYMFPRAIESFYHQMTLKKVMPDFRGGSILLFCATISSLMYFREYEPSTLSNLLKKIFDLFLPKRL
eukprot:TRINITY_DN5061_c1_g1_i1.p1 TRINITY_DN5061_c1_g1~~TRINITY_DN5061_c1_g1_i1.p1  ORF type:complete len:433 (+),score=102.48 TRINITY_DN5061_c1_g1_i1:75-1373(+)